MPKTERIHRIKEITFERKQIDVATLSSLPNVTEVTIWNGLGQLEQSGFLTRYHGGATLSASTSPEQPDSNGQVDFFNMSYDKEKEELEYVVANLVREREWIFLGPGTTCYYTVRALSKRQNLNIMTNNFSVAGVFANSSSVQLISLGGQMQYSGTYTVPEDLNKDLEHIFLSKFFSSADAASPEGGYCPSDINVLDTICTVSSRCQESTICVDSKKYDQRSFSWLGDPDYVPTAVTNSSVPAEYHKYYTEHGIRTYTPFDLAPLKL